MKKKAIWGSAKKVRAYKKKEVYMLCIIQCTDIYVTMNDMTDAIFYWNRYF